MKHDIRAAQARLAALGFDPGPVDGIPGRRTIAAVKAFQRARGLAADGLVGPQSRAALFGGTAATPPQGAGVSGAWPWLDIAEAKMGLHETADFARLRDFLRSDGRTLGDPRKLPWCGDFVETCIALALPEEALPANPYLARNWLKFGTPTRPQTGAVLVFRRGAPDGVSGHVGFYRAEDGEAYHVLGGNQSNRVSIARIRKSRLLGARWPLTAMPGGGSRVTASGGGAFSTNEE